MKRMSPSERRLNIYKVFRAIGTRYVGQRGVGSAKVNAAMRDFDVLNGFGGPAKFFRAVAGQRGTESKISFVSKQLQYFKKKGARDTLIELRIDEHCMALDLRIKRILAEVGASVPKSLNERAYSAIEEELIKKVAEPSGLSGGELDRTLFQNYGDILIQLTC